MSAQAHEESASNQAEQAAAHERRYESWETGSFDGQPRGPERLEPYNPAAMYQRLARLHRKHASEHLQAARILREFEGAECEAFTPEIRTACPLIGQIDAVDELPNGVRVRLREGIDVQAATAHMRCHLAFARTRGGVGMVECPLYLRGVRVEPVAGSRRIDLVPASSDDLEELRLRTHRHLD